MKYTDKQVKIFNKMLSAYQNIDCDSELDKNKLTYQEYKSLGYLMDCLRFNKTAETVQEGVANWFKSFGFTVIEKDIGYRIGF